MLGDRRRGGGQQRPSRVQSILIVSGVNGVKGTDAVAAAAGRGRGPGSYDAPAECNQF